MLANGIRVCLPTEPELQEPQEDSRAPPSAGSSLSTARRVDREIEALERELYGGRGSLLPRLGTNPGALPVPYRVRCWAPAARASVEMALPPELTICCPRQVPNLPLDDLVAEQRAILAAGGRGQASIQDVETQTGWQTQLPSAAVAWGGMSDIGPRRGVLCPCSRHRPEEHPECTGDDRRHRLCHRQGGPQPAVPRSVRRPLLLTWRPQAPADLLVPLALQRRRRWGHPTWRRCCPIPAAAASRAA